MRHLTSALTAIVLTLDVIVNAGFAARQSRPQDIALQAAIRTETVDGDLPAAIKQYEAVVAKYRTDDRAAAAKALVRMAECYRKLGRPVAQALYRQVLTEFADQKEAVALAQSHLAPAEPTAPAERWLWTLPKTADFQGPVSYDGRYLAYIDWSPEGAADLFVRTIATGTEQRMTESGNTPDTPFRRWADRPTFSRDGRQIAYSWVDDEAGRYQIRIAPVPIGAGTAARVLVSLEGPAWIDPHDWTADGQWIAAMWKDSEGPRQMGLVSTRDGSRRALRAITLACDPNLALSPDGKYLAFDMPGVETTTRDIFVVSTETGQETHIPYAGDDVLAGWSPDGTSVVFTSDRSGDTGLWALPISNGHPGVAKPIRPGVGLFELFGVTRAGAVFFCRCEPPRGSDIKIAEFDFATGRFLSLPVDAVQEFVGTNSQPFWSHDGTRFAYRSLRLNRDPILVVRSADGADVRELKPKLGMIWDPRWSPDDRSILLLASDFEDRWGIRRVDVATGTSTLLMPARQGWFTGMMEWSKDGRTFYFKRGRRGAEKEIAFAALDVASGEARDLVHVAGADTLAVTLSSDERTVFYRQPPVGTLDFVVMALDLASGSKRELLRGPAIGGMNESPDGRYLAVARQPQGEIPGAVLLVPVNGSAAVELIRGEPGEAFGAEPSLPRGPGTWALDSQSLIVRRGTDRDRPEFWWVPIDGRGPRRLTEFDGLNPAGLRVHPDGRRLLFGASLAGQPEPRPTELWVWDGLLAKIGR